MVMNGQSLKNYRIESYWSESRREQAYVHVPVIHCMWVCDDDCNNDNADDDADDDNDVCCWYLLDNHEQISKTENCMVIANDDRMRCSCLPYEYECQLTDGKAAAFAAKPFCSTECVFRISYDKHINKSSFILIALNFARLVCYYCRWL